MREEEVSFIAIGKEILSQLEAQLKFNNKNLVENE